MSQLDVTVTLGTLAGAMKESAYYEDANQFNPFDTCPCPEGERADISYLTCGPDRDDMYVGGDIYKQGEATIVAQSGVTSTPSGIMVSATGDSEEYQKLFALPLYAFDSREAEYALTVTLKGDFDMMANMQPYTRMDLIMGLGNSQKFIGVRKTDKQDQNMAYYVQGSYDGTSSRTANSVLVVEGTPEPMGVWNDGLSADNRPTASTIKVRFTARRNRNMAVSMINMTITAKQYGADGNSQLGSKLEENFLLEGKELGYEFVVFRQNRRQTFLVKDVGVQLCGCNEADGIAGCEVDAEGL